MKYTEKDFENYSTRYRANFFHSITGFKNIALIGTKSKSGQSNLAIFNSILHLGSNPPLIAILFRPSEEIERHTLQNILATDDFTINLLDESFIDKAHQTSAKYSKEVSEFEATGLTEEYMEGCHAPFVKESSVKIYVELLEKKEISQNKTSLVIAKIKGVYLDPMILSEDGFADLSKLNIMAGAGLDGYVSTKLETRFSYARPGKELEKI